MYEKTLGNDYTTVPCWADGSIQEERLTECELHSAIVQKGPCVNKNMDLPFSGGVGRGTHIFMPFRDRSSNPFNPRGCQKDQNG